MSNKTNHLSQFERGYRILQYLKKHTDKDHPVEQRDLRKTEIAHFLGKRDTYNALIHSMADSLNSEYVGQDRECLPESEWRIFFDRYLKLYGSSSRDEEEEDSEDELGEEASRIRNLYYQPVFTHEELDAIIEGVQFSKNLGKEARDTIIGKIHKDLANVHYKKHHQGIECVHEPIWIDRGVVQENIHLVRKAIATNKQISFQFNGYNNQKRLVPVNKRTAVSPYYIVANSGRYYLVGAWESHSNRRGRMCTYRIDLLTDIMILQDQRLAKRDVDGLPQTWSEDFAISHLNMAYDNPVAVKLKITGRCDNWTFLYDWFGDSFDVWNGDVVTVSCSPYAMVNWALQYSDRVEVLEPAVLRKAVADRVRALAEKYEI